MRNNTWQSTKLEGGAHFVLQQTFYAKRNRVMAPLRWSTINTVKRCRTLSRATAFEQKTTQRSHAQDCHNEKSDTQHPQDYRREAGYSCQVPGRGCQIYLPCRYILSHLFMYIRETSDTCTMSDRIEAQNSYTLLFRVVNRS